MEVRSMVRLISALVAALFLAGAAQAQVVVYYDDTRSFYTPAYFGYVVGLGPVPTVVHNSPFPASAVAARIPMPGFVGRGSFIAAASGAEILAYDRLVLAFNAGAVSAPALCGQPQVAGGPGGARTELVAVLCRGTSPASYAVLTAPAASSPDDPQFRALLAQMTTVVMPPKRIDGGCGPTGGNMC
jgi:hypothetical protein